jgi:electron transfer flavoprotein beta subunit
MLHIIACCKWVIDEAYVRPGRGGEVDLSAVDWKLSDYDRHALEEAVRIREVIGGKVTVLTVGDERSAKGMKDMLSRGADEGCLISDKSFNFLDPAQTAGIIIGAINAHLTPFDLILFGDGSSDLYARQVGPRVAAGLKIPCVTGASRITVKEGGVEVERSLERVVEVVRVNLPVAITVLPEINVPRIPGVRDTLSAAKKPVINLGREMMPEGEKPALNTKELKINRFERACVKMENTPQGVLRLVEELRKKGVLTA